LRFGRLFRSRLGRRLVRRPVAHDESKDVDVGAEDALRGRAAGVRVLKRRECVR
jgi:hypothetical protein